MKVKVSIFDEMEQITEEEIQRLLPLVSDERREEALRYKHLFGQFACLKSYVMLRELLEEQGLTHPFLFERNEAGGRQALLERTSAETGQRAERVDWCG